MSDLNRRDFLKTAAATAVVISLPVLQAHGAPGGTAAKKVDIGTLADYPKDGVTDKYAAAHKFFVVRDDSKLYACSSLCTHKMAQLQVKDNELYCPKHKSEFTFQGTVTKGPAKNSLPRYAITKADDGKLSVDPGKDFSETKWEDPASFVAIPK